MSRPTPPPDLLEHLFLTLRPAPEVWEWIQREILAETGSIHNPEHSHLIDASIGVLWASSAFEKKGRTVLGQAEQLMIRAGGWTATYASAVEILQCALLKWLLRAPILESHQA